MTNINVIQSNIYNGDIVAGSLLIPESRKIAGLLLQNTNPEVGWKQAIEINNILQKRSPASAIRQAKLIRNRLMLMKPELWDLIYQGSADLATQALLAASIKHSRLLGDFMDKTIRDNWLTFKGNISAQDWRDFLAICGQIDPKIAKWKESTRLKLKQVIFRILAEAKYIDGTRTLKLLPVLIIPQIKKYLIKNSEKYILQCMDITR